MVVFEQVQSSRLFQSTSSAVGAGWWGFQVITGAAIDGTPIPLDRALQDAKLSGTFIYATSAPDFSTPQKISDFIEAIDEILSFVIGGRALIFLPTGETSQIKPQIAKTVALTQRGSIVSTNTGINVPLCNTGVLTAQIAAGSGITISGDENGLVFDGGSSPSVSLGGLLSSDTFQPDNLATLQFSGMTQGTFSFNVFIRRLALSTELNWGFQTLIPNQNVGTNKDALLYLAAWLPLADGTAQALQTCWDSLRRSTWRTRTIYLRHPHQVVFYRPEFRQQPDHNQTLASFYRTKCRQTDHAFPCGEQH